jgi:4-amino-4-deoxy-L-arabinose transferase-like glycosyltransferase
MVRRRISIAGVVAVAASAVFALAAAWEMGAPLQGGHWASMAACAIAAENMLRFHLFAAVTHYVARPPPSHADDYVRHPYLIYVMEAVARAVLGRHPWVIRLPAVACSAATPLVLFRLGRVLWGPTAGAVAAVAFVVVPIDLAFAMFSSLEVPTILFGLIFCVGTVQAWEKGRTSDVVVAAIGALGACHGDWIGVLLVALVLAYGATRLIVPRLRRDIGNIRAFRRWWLASAAVTLGSVLLYAWLIGRSGQWVDLLRGARMRSMDYHPLTLGLRNPFQLARRMMRLQWMVPSLGFGVLLAALPVAVWRMRSRAAEVFLPAWTVTASAQYLLFPQGADMHMFWPHYFGPCIALAMGTLTSALLERSRATHAVRAAGLVAIVAVPLALMVRVAVPMLEQSRLTQGRFDERGTFIESGAAASQFAAWATRDAPRDALVRCTRLCGSNVEYATGLAQVGGPPELTPRAPSDRDRIELVDARFTPAAKVRELSSKFEVAAVGPLLRVDLAKPEPSFRAMRLEERQPKGLERLLLTDHDLVRAIGDADPWATWQWAEALDRPLPEDPTGEPVDLEELTVAFNVARVAGDRARAEDLRGRALAGLSWRTTRGFTDDVHLLGTFVEQGAVPVVTLLWETGPTFVRPADTTFLVRCHTTRPPALWPVPIDPLEKDVAPPMTWVPSTWRPNHLYMQRFVWLQRPGTEACRGYFEPNTLQPVDGRSDVELDGLRPWD